MESVNAECINIMSFHFLIMLTVSICSSSYSTSSSTIFSCFICLWRTLKVYNIVSYLTEIIRFKNRKKKLKMESIARLYHIKYIRNTKYMFE